MADIYPLRGITRGFTERLRDICHNRCKASGVPPCFFIQSLKTDCDIKVIEPCKECMEEANANEH